MRGAVSTLAIWALLGSGVALADADPEPAVEPAPQQPVALGGEQQLLPGMTLGLPEANSPPRRPDQPLARPEPPRRPCRPGDHAGSALFSLPTFGCDFPDPMVLRAGGTYYAYSTATDWQRGDGTFPILRSTDLRRWSPVGTAFPGAAPAWADGHFWAPSVLARNGRFVMYYSARRRRDGVHCVAVATATSPAGPFADRGPIACGDRRGRGYIDPAPLVHRGKGWLYFSVDGPRHSISMLALSPDLLRTRGSRRPVIGVPQRWRRLADPTVEAPWPVRRGKRFYLFYSAGCWCADYRMTYSVADHPQGPYRHARGLILEGAPGGFVAPGGGSLVSDRRGGSWMAFHDWTGAPDYDHGGIRTLRTAPLTWRGGRPRLKF